MIFFSDISVVTLFIILWEALVLCPTLKSFVLQGHSEENEGTAVDSEGHLMRIAFDANTKSKQNEMLQVFESTSFAGYHLLGKLESLSITPSMFNAKRASSPPSHGIQSTKPSSTIQLECPGNSRGIKSYHGEVTLGEWVVIRVCSVFLPATFEPELSPSRTSLRSWCLPRRR